jgi:tripartite-type tricarboxylate transporter receptor subunit TctC
MRITFGRLAVAVALSLSANAASAQTYPTRQIQLIVPFAAGGPADLLGRIIADEMSKDFGQHVIVENRPGANTIIGAQAVAHADPDGYTVLMAIDGTLVMNPYLYSKLPYDPFKDFAPVSLIAQVASVLEANINVPVNSVKELIAAEKAKPGSYLVGVSTPTSQVTAALINMMAGINMQMIPYKGGTTQVTGLLAGDIQLGMESLNVAHPLAQGGKLKILAVTAAQRTALAPDIPAIAETIPGFDLGIWQSIVVPANTPREVVSKLHDELVTLLSRDTVRQKLTTAGVDPATSKSPEDFAAFIRSQAETRSKVIKAVGLKLD